MPRLLENSKPGDFPHLEIQGFEIENRYQDIQLFEFRSLHLVHDTQGYSSKKYARKLDYISPASFSTAPANSRDLRTLLRSSARGIRALFPFRTWLRLLSYSSCSKE